jgi:hypothetical protein
MKIILSRKGFDSSNGGMPSPILPDGRMLSLPIPSSKGRRPEECRFGKQTYRDLIDQLRKPSKKNWDEIDTVHLDPDLVKGTAPRVKGWRPSLGQTGPAASHLRDQGVGEGDLFLFFGWFRETEIVDGELRYARHAPNIHCIFGWLQVAEVFRVEQGDGAPPQQGWLKDHPHVEFSHKFDGGSDIYVASRDLQIDGISGGIPGGGAFERYNKKLRLTAPEESRRSRWLLPDWFMNEDGGSKMTYNIDSENWFRGPEGAYLKSAAIGQEFVFDCAGSNGCFEWISEHFSAGM